MISTFKIKTQNNQIKIWLGSDFHLGHICVGWENPLWKSRGYNSVEDHDSGIINKINKSVNPELIVTISCSWQEITIILGGNFIKI